MKIKITIDATGQVITEVVDRFEHLCSSVYRITDAVNKQLDDEEADGTPVPKPAPVVEAAPKPAPKPRKRAHKADPDVYGGESYGSLDLTSLHRLPEDDPEDDPGVPPELWDLPID